GSASVGLGAARGNAGQAAGADDTGGPVGAAQIQRPSTELILGAAVGIDTADAGRRWSDRRARNALERRRQREAPSPPRRPAGWWWWWLVDDRKPGRSSDRRIAVPGIDHRASGSGVHGPGAKCRWFHAQAAGQ